MKILVVTQYFYPETFRVNTLCAELARRGHDVTVLTGYPQYPQGKIYDGYGFHKPYETLWNGVKIQRIKMRPRGKTPLGLLRNCYTFVSEGKKWVRRCQETFDAVYVFEVSPVTVGLPAVAYKEKFGAPVLFNVQDLWPENVEIVLGIHNRLIIGTIHKIVDKIYGASDKILCSSRSFVENIAARGVSREKLAFWPQFCAEPQLEGKSKPECYRDDCFNIVFTGNIGDAQGLDLLIDVAGKLRDTRIRWFLVGDGRARERLQNRVLQEKLEESVVFLGRVSEEEANRYTHFADCAYLSFQNNRLFDMTLPAKLQSYMACKTPILAVAGGESARVVQEADCGFVCPQDAEKVCSLLRDKVLSCGDLAAYGQRGYAYYHAHFRMEEVVDRLEAYLLEVSRKDQCVYNP